MLLNMRWLADIAHAVATIDRIFPKSRRAKTNASQLTKTMLERFNSASEDERMDVIRAVCDLSWVCGELLKDVGTIELRIDKDK